MTLAPSPPSETTAPARTSPSYRACGLRVDALGPDDAVDRIVRIAADGQPASVHLCNAYTLALTYRQPELAELIDGSDLNLMDGMPLVWTARRLGFDECRDRVYGPDLMLSVMREGRDNDLGHYLYGSTPDVVRELRENLEREIPGVRIVGAESPPFRPLTQDEEDETVERIRRSGAHVVWVGLGTPKQDEAVERLRGRTRAVLVAVGAAFDFHAGRKRQAPRWMQRHGLEWLFRLITEPRRLWRRYLIGNLVFLLGLARTLQR